MVILKLTNFKQRKKNDQEEFVTICVKMNQTTRAGVFLAIGIFFSE